MIPWLTRSPEERALLNPSFLSLLLWRAAAGHMAQGGAGLPLTSAFLVLPLVLHRETRESLPRTLATSIPVWLEDNPIVLARIAERTRALVPYTKEALLFAGVYGFLTISGETITADQTWKRRATANLNSSSDEVRACAKRAEFLGRWFARTGSAATVMALMGVRP